MVNIEFQYVVLSLPKISFNSCYIKVVLHFAQNVFYLFFTYEQHKLQLREEELGHVVLLDLISFQRSSKERQYSLSSLIILFYYLVYYYTVKKYYYYIVHFYVFIITSLRMGMI